MQVIKVNGKEIELEKATSVEVYLESAGYQMKRIAVELNGEILPKNEYADRMLEDGDCMEVVTFVGGAENGDNEGFDKRGNTGCT